QADLKKQELQTAREREQLQREKAEFQNQQADLKKQELQTAREREQLEREKAELEKQRQQLIREREEWEQKKAEKEYYVISLGFNATKQEQPAILFETEDKSLFFKRQGECVKLKKQDFSNLEILMIETEERFNLPRQFNVLCSFRWETVICQANNYSITRTPEWDGMYYSIEPVESINDTSNCVEI
ncbi:MAG: hypothetical protein OXJ52_05760, partial [Oligoflexia bacterium]|nr:hypothetical protein [Oligoflexia bacterium]